MLNLGLCPLSSHFLGLRYKVNYTSLLGMTRNQLWRADHWPLWAPTVASAGGCQPSSKSNLYRNGRTNMYNVNIKVHRVPKQYFRNFVYCKNARDVRTHLKMFVHSMSKRKPMHFNQIWPKFRNLQSFLIQLQEGTFLHFYATPRAGSFVRGDGKCTGCSN